ncbi:hypothetical protein QHF83_24490, partial [Polyangium sp. 15x6]
MSSSAERTRAFGGVDFVVVVTPALSAGFEPACARGGGAEGERPGGVEAERCAGGGDEGERPGGVEAARCAGGGDEGERAGGV